MSKFKVLYINTHHDLGGASNSLLDMISGLGNRIEPIVLVPLHGELEKECHRRGIQCIVTPFASLINTIHPHTIRNILRKPWRISYIQRLRQDLPAIRKLMPMLRNLNINLVHTNVSDCTIGMWLALLLRIPHIWHVRESLTNHFQIRVCGGVPRLRRRINRANARIVISHALKDNWGFGDDHTFVINDAVLGKNNSYKLCPKEKYFLFASFGISKLKGADVVVEAYGKSGLSTKGYSLMLLGHVSEEFKNELITIAQRYNCEDKLIFHPFTPHVRLLYEHASAYIQGSIYEGLGRTTAEAMFYGCPVIATAYSGGTLDLIRDRQTGYLFNTVEECSALMNEVVSTDQTDLCLRAQQWATENLTIEVYGPKVWEVYKQVLS